MQPHVLYLPRISSINSWETSSTLVILEYYNHTQVLSHSEMEPLRKITHQYAHHVIPLECDVYDAINYANDAPVFLFFHAGGLVGGSRTCVPPWLVQVRNRCL